MTWRDWLGFWWRWRIRLGLPAGYHPAIHGSVVDWSSDWRLKLAEGLRTVPPRLIRLASVNVFPAHDLRRAAGGPIHDGVAYEIAPRSLARDLPGVQPPWNDLLYARRRWTGLNADLFTNPAPHPDLPVPKLHAILFHELAHAWDYRLEAEDSPYASSGKIFLAVYDQTLARPRRFPLLGFDPYDIPEEVWAWAVVWCVYLPGEMRRDWPDYYEFVGELFSRYRITP